MRCSGRDIPCSPAAPQSPLSLVPHPLSGQVAIECAFLEYRAAEVDLVLLAVGDVAVGFVAGVVARVDWRPWMTGGAGRRRRNNRRAAWEVRDWSDILRCGEV